MRYAQLSWQEPLTYDEIRQAYKQVKALMAEVSDVIVNYYRYHADTPGPRASRGTVFILGNAKHFRRDVEFFHKALTLVCEDAPPLESPWIDAEWRPGEGLSRLGGITPRYASVNDLGWLEYKVTPTGNGRPPAAWPHWYLEAQQ